MWGGLRGAVGPVGCVRGPAALHRAAAADAYAGVRVAAGSAAGSSTSQPPVSTRSLAHTLPREAAGPRLGRE